MIGVVVVIGRMSTNPGTCQVGGSHVVDPA